MELKDIKNLADLARLDLTDEEMIGIAKDFDSILAYVGQVQEVSKNIDQTNGSNDTFLKNIMREDEVTNKNGEYTEKIMQNTPSKEDNYLKVKQIL